MRLPGVLLPPSPNAQDDGFVLVMREPFELAASFYSFHHSGQECRLQQGALCSFIRSHDIKDGMLYIVGILLEYELPSMLLTSQAMAGRSDVHILRLESLSFDYDSMCFNLLRFLEVPSTMMRLLFAACKRHDSSQWSKTKVEQSKHVDLYRYLPKGITKRDLFDILQANETICTSLAQFSFTLGYAGSFQAASSRCHSGLGTT